MRIVGGITIAAVLPRRRVVNGEEAALAVIRVNNARAVRGDDRGHAADRVADELNGLGTGAGDTAVGKDKPTATGQNLFLYTAGRAQMQHRAIGRGQRVVRSDELAAGRVVRACLLQIVVTIAAAGEQGRRRIELVIDARVGDVG